ncbi:unnamed protein product, partial [marine sediment metagenome]
MELCISFQKSDGSTHIDKIVNINKIETLIETLWKHGYHVFRCFENAPETHIKKVDIGGYTDETEQSREVC